MPKMGDFNKKILRMYMFFVRVSRTFCRYFQRMVIKAGVNGGDRTHDHQSHNLVLYQLSYIHHEQRKLYVFGLKMQLKNHVAVLCDGVFLMAKLMCVTLCAIICHYSTTHITRKGKSMMMSKHIFVALCALVYITGIQGADKEASQGSDKPASDFVSVSLPEGTSIQDVQNLKDFLLLAAVMEKDEETVASLLAQGADITRRFSDEQCKLMQDILKQVNAHETTPEKKEPQQK
jgi:hypothetical protein